MKKLRLLSLFLIFFVSAAIIFSTGGCYSRADFGINDGVLTERKVNEISNRFHITNIERIYDTTTGGAGAEEVNQVPAGFKSGSMRVVVGTNDRGERVRLFIDKNNRVNPEETAFIIPY
ncbi:MAG: hypothetical protein Q8930_11905 [Bacillota bacterium]|nr:hypothetical protein [Bacillota bacterium]